MKCNFKEEIDKEVKQLLELKEDFKKLTGQEWKAEDGSSQARGKKETDANKKQPESAPKAPKEEGAKKQTRFGSSFFLFFQNQLKLRNYFIIG